MPFTISSIAKKKLMEIPGVVGVSVGLKEKGGELTEQECLRLFVEKKLALGEVPAGQVIPSVFGGRITDVVEATFEPAGLNGREGIGGENDRGGGTLGLLFDYLGRYYGLTNEHVLWRKGRDLLSTSVWQMDPRRVIGSVTGFVRPESGAADAAVFELCLRGPSRNRGLTVSGRSAGGTRWPDWKPEFSLVGFEGFTQLGLGDQVWKLGRTTGRTEGRVSDVQLTIKMNYGIRGVLILRGQILVRQGEPKVPFILSGDSGSVLCSEGRVGGLLFGMAGIGKYGLATDIRSTFLHLGMAYHSIKL